jgi:hypothetical protein
MVPQDKGWEDVKEVKKVPNVKNDPYSSCVAVVLELLLLQAFVSSMDVNW